MAEKFFKNSFIQKLINPETVSYVIAGVLTTLVDYAVFIVINEMLSRSGHSETFSAMTATAVAWAAAVVFAFIVNKFIVFRSRTLDPASVVKELTAFVSARVISGVVVMIFMWILVDRLHINEYVSKILTSVFNVVFNYVASKFFIFKKK